MVELIVPTRRGFLAGLGAILITAPAIVRAASLMVVKVMPPEDELRRIALFGENDAWHAELINCVLRCSAGFW